jgi:PAS domain S-box-containing protein
MRDQAQRSSDSRRKHTVLQVMGYLVIIILMSNLDALVDAVFHPDIPYFDPVHLIVGGATSFVCILVFGLIGLYARRLSEQVIRLKQSEEMAQQSEEKFRTMADFTYDWEYWIDPERTPIYISPSCKRITGYSPDDFKKAPTLLETITYPEDRPHFVKHLREETKIDQACDFDFRIMTRKGEVKWISHTCQPVHGLDGRYLGNRASNRDITVRKRVEEDRERLVIELQEALTKVKTLSGMLPMCASCKKIRDDKGYWEQIEVYIREHSEVDFSHGLCPDCATKLYPEFYPGKQKPEDNVASYE